MKELEDKQPRYEAPRLTVVLFRTERGYAASMRLFGLFHGWYDNGADAWDDSGESELGNRIGGWTDNGSSAWD